MVASKTDQIQEDTLPVKTRLQKHYHKPSEVFVELNSELKVQEKGVGRGEGEESQVQW